MTKRALLAAGLLALLHSGPSHAGLLPIVWPQLIRIDTSGSDTPGEFALPAAAIRAPVTQLRLRFNLPMAAPAVDDFRLLASGADGVRSTVDCASVGGDDIALDILQALAAPGDGSEIVLRPDAPTGLPRGDYRLLVCDTLQSSLGIALDGDMDFDAGGIAMRDFSIEETPRLGNPGFDTDVAGWHLHVLTPGPSALEFSTLDADGAAGSGAAHVTGLGVLLASDTCMLRTGTSNTWRLRLRYKATAIPVRIIARAYFGFGGDMPGEEDACVGPGIPAEVAFVARPEDGYAVFDSGWRKGYAFPIAEYTLQLVPLAPGPIDLLLDDIGFSFNPDVVFRDDFER